MGNVERPSIQLPAYCPPMRIVDDLTPPGSLWRLQSCDYGVLPCAVTEIVGRPSMPPATPVPAESGQGRKEHMVGVGDDGIATSNGSRPPLQWWIATPFESLVPSFVPKSVVTVNYFW